MPKQSDVHTHGRLAGGKLHRVATSVLPGFLSAEDKQLLDELREGLDDVTGVTAGTYGDSTHVGQFTVNAAGKLTSAVDVAIAFPVADSVLVNLAATTDANFNDTTPAQPANSVNVRWQSSGASPTSISANFGFTVSTPISVVLTAHTIAVSHATSGVIAATYGNASTVGVFTVNNTGHITSASNSSIAINANQITAGTLVGARGGTGNSASSNGDLLVGTGPSSWTRLASGAVGTILQVTSAGVLSWSAVPASFGTQTANTFFAGPASGAPATPTFRAIVTDDYLTSTSTATGVTNAKLRQSVGVSVIGRSANSTGAPADITASADSQVLMRRSSTVGFNQLLASEVSNDSKLASVAGYDVDQVAEALSMVGSVQGWIFDAEHFGGIGQFDAQVGFTVTTVVGSGAAHLGTQVTTKEHPGVAYMTTQAVDDGVCCHLGTVNLMLGGGYHFGETIMTFDALNGVTTDYWYLFGLTNDNNTNVYPTDGVFFLYDLDDINTDPTGTLSNWMCITRAASTSTVTNSGVAVAACGSTTTWSNSGDQRLRYEINAAGTEVKFYINGTLVATHTTNIPSSTTSLGPMHKLTKNSGTAGRVWMFVDKTTFGGLVTLTSGERG